VKLSRILITATFAFAAMFAGSAALADTSSAQPITITASNWKFTPGEITVHVGQPVTLKLTSAEGVHGLGSSDLGIPQTMLVPGSDKNVTFTPSKAGTYVLHCTIPCGPGHANMKLVIHVVS